MRFSVYHALSLAVVMMTYGTDAVNLTDPVAAKAAADAAAAKDLESRTATITLDPVGGDCHKFMAKTTTTAQTDVDHHHGCCGPKISVNNGECICEDQKPLTQRVLEAQKFADTRCPD